MFGGCFNCFRNSSQKFTRVQTFSPSSSPGASPKISRKTQPTLAFSKDLPRIAAPYISIIDVAAANMERFGARSNTNSVLMEDDFVFDRSVHIPGRTEENWVTAEEEKYPEEVRRKWPPILNPTQIKKLGEILVGIKARYSDSRTQKAKESISMGRFLKAFYKVHSEFSAALHKPEFSEFSNSFCQHFFLGAHDTRTQLKIAKSLNGLTTFFANELSNNQMVNDACKDVKAGRVSLVGVLQVCLTILDDAHKEFRRRFPDTATNLVPRIPKPQINDPEDEISFRASSKHFPIKGGSGSSSGSAESRTSLIRSSSFFARQ